MFRSACHVSSTTRAAFKQRWTAMAGTWVNACRKERARWNATWYAAVQQQSKCAAADAGGASLFSHMNGRRCWARATRHVRNSNEQNARHMAVNKSRFTSGNTSSSSSSSSSTYNILILIILYSHHVALCVISLSLSTHNWQLSIGNALSYNNNNSIWHDDI